MPRRTAALKKTWSLTTLRQKLGPRCHDVGERGQPNSRRRIYNRPFLDCLTEIDSAIGRLKGRGAGTIVSAGSSL